MNKDESTSRHLKPVHASSRWTGYKRLNFSAHRYRRFAQQAASGQERANIVTCSAVPQKRKSSVAAQAKKKGERL
jgi:hypothetical protein